MLGAQTIDYRVSRIVVLCRDCGRDVGLYPARHKCENAERPPLPSSKPLPSLSNSKSPASSGSSATQSPETPKELPLLSKSYDSPDTEIPPVPQATNHQDDSVYFKMDHLTDSTNSESPSSSGKKLWGKVRQNSKWKSNADKSEPKKANKLWDKLVQATQNVADKIPSREDRSPDSDESDWEGETHVSRIIREYYEKSRQPLPEWLRDNRMRVQSEPRGETTLTSTPSRRGRRLWEEGPDQSPRQTQRNARSDDSSGSRYGDYQRRPSRRDVHPPEDARERYKPSPPPSRSFQPEPDRHVEDAYREPHRDAYREPPRDAYREPPRDNYREPPRDNYREPPRDNYREPPRDNYREPPREAYREPQRDPFRDQPSRGAYRDAYMDPPRDRPEDSYREPHRDPYHDHPPADYRRPMPPSSSHEPEYSRDRHPPPRDRRPPPPPASRRYPDYNGGGYF